MRFGIKSEPVKAKIYNLSALLILIVGLECKDLYFYFVTMYFSHLDPSFIDIFEINNPTSMISLVEMVWLEINK